MANEYVDNCKKMLKVFEDRPWLFKKNDLIPVAEYLLYFERKNKKGFFVFPTMLPFNIPILDEFQKKVFNTLFLPTMGGQLNMNTIVQVSADYHIFFLYGYSPEGDVVVYATLYTTDPLDYRDFMKKYEEYLHEDKKNLGFSGGVIPDRGLTAIDRTEKKDRNSD